MPDAMMNGGFAPYLAQELWEQLGHKDDLLHVAWPSFDPALAKEDEVVVIVQINGRVRSRLTVPASTTQDDLREAALRHERTQEWIAGKTIRKVIVVPQKLVNIVVA